MKKHIKISVFIFLLLLFAGCSAKKEALISGKTMGTTYHVKIVTGYFNSVSDLKEKIDDKLENINKSMSTFIKDSEISKFNAFNHVEEKFYPSDDFFYIMTVARNLYELTNGAWDGTVKPLINLWGFGSSETKKKIPPRKKIDKLLDQTGFNYIGISEDRYLFKRKPLISIDLGSIAKGYAVDQVSALIRKNGIKDFLVEIGGEVFASGLRKDGKQWRVGINAPKIYAPFNQVWEIVALRDRALATSGDYRDFFEIEGNRYSHIIDPRTGCPVTESVASVSITADTCVFADGLATAVMVLGHKQGLELVEKTSGVECLIVVKGKDGKLTNFYSRGFKNDK